VIDFDFIIFIIFGEGSTLKIYCEIRGSFFTVFTLNLR